MAGILVQGVDAWRGVRTVGFFQLVDFCDLRERGFFGVCELAPLTIGAFTLLILLAYFVEGFRLWYITFRCVTILLILFDCKLGPTPEDYGDPSKLIVSFLGQCIDPMLPVDIDAAPKGEGHPIHLWKIRQGAMLHMPKGQLPFTTQGNSHSDVLLAQSSLTESCSIMVQRLPVGSINIPVEAGVD